jgi:hypothetical protein
MIKLTPLIVLSFVCTASLFPMNRAEAKVVPKMKQYFVQKIKDVDKALALSQAENEPPAGQDPRESAVVLQAINFDLSPSVSFGISEFLNITVSPEIDFVLTPVLP